MRSTMLRATVALSLVTTAALAQEDAQVMEMVDSNHDGGVALDEVQMFAQIGWRMLDVNGEGKLVIADMLSVPGGPVFLGGVTGDDKGEITREQFFGSVPTRFKAADHNNDAFLDAREFRAYLGLPAAAPVAPAAVPAPVGIKLQNPSGLPSCTGLASNPKFGLAGHPGVSKIGARVSCPQPAAHALLIARSTSATTPVRRGPRMGMRKGSRRPSAFAWACRCARTMAAPVRGTVASKISAAVAAWAICRTSR